MGKFREITTIVWPCTADVPRGNGSKLSDKEKFKVEFKYYDIEQRKEFPTVDREIAKDEDYITFNKQWTELVANSIVGWSELDDLPFNDTNLEKLLNSPPYLEAVRRGFTEAQNGAEIKN